MNSASIAAAPVEGQKVEHEGKLYTTIKEGLAYILVPIDAPLTLDPKHVKNGLIESQSVFYNPIQQFNRDLSVLAIKAFGDDLVAVRKAKAELKAKKQNRGPKEKRGVKRKANGEEVSKADDLIDAAVPPIDATSTPGNEVFAEGQTRNPSVAPNGIESTATEEKNESAATNMDISTGNDIHTEQTIIEETNMPLNDSLDTAEGTKNPEFKIKFRILDALSATGLRALRYAQEIPDATSITANDLSAQAVASIKTNVSHNKLDGKIKAITGNALAHMYSFVTQPTDERAKLEARYDVIDLDPYGTAVPFLDAAVQALNDGGLLCVTCTDAGVWASNGYPEKAYSLYGGTPIRGLHSHEGGLRLILHAIASSAARYGMSIEPLLSLSIDFYARVFVRVYRSPIEVKMLAGKTMLVYCCDHGCGAWQTQFIGRNIVSMGKDGKTPFTKHGLAQGPTANMFCEHCGFKQHLSGPMYGGPLHNPHFIQTILDYLPGLDKTTYATTSRIEGMLLTALEETLLDDPEVDASGEEATAETTAEPSLKVDGPPFRPVPHADASKIDRYPFYFIPSALARVLHTTAPGEAPVRGALRHAGYRVTRSHCKPGTIRTDAPWTFIWEMMREWVRQKAPVRQGAIKQGTAGWKIMGKELAEAEGNSGQSGEGKASEPHAETTSGAEEAEKEDGKMDVDKPAREVEIVFDEKLGREVNRRRLVRYQTNPRANWGPMNRAKGKGRNKKEEENVE